MDKAEWDELLRQRRSAVGEIAFHARLDGDPKKEEAAREKLARIREQINEVITAGGRPPR